MKFKKYITEITDDDMADSIAKKLKNKKFQVAYKTRLSRSKDTLKPVLKYHPECKKIITDDRMIIFPGKKNSLE